MIHAILDFFFALLSLLLVGLAFGLVVYLASVVWHLAKENHYSSIPPYIQGKPEVTFKGPVRNRMRHVLSF